MFLLDSQQKFVIVYSVLLGLLGLLFICSVVFFIIRLVKIQKKAKKSVVEEDKNIYLEALGGKENLLDISRNLSRITFKVNNIDNVDCEKLKETGASGILLVGNEVKCSFNELSENVYKIVKGDK